MRANLHIHILRRLTVLTLAIGFIAPAALRANATERPAFLANMPMNSERRCVGIVAVTDALLNGTSTSEGLVPNASQLADVIYNSRLSGSPIRFRDQVRIGDKVLDVTTTEALNHLGTLVTSKYVRNHQRAADRLGSIRLERATSNYLPNVESLQNSLASDPDQMRSFFGTGTRWFDSGLRKPTRHAFFIQARPDGRFVVHDPNDPGAPISCRVETKPDGLRITWRCRYRDTGETTTQSYRIVDAASVFENVFARTYR